MAARNDDRNGNRFDGARFSLCKTDLGIDETRTGSLSSSAIFELCAETLDACLAARDGGAHRIELCCSLNEGGLTPQHWLIEQAIRQSGLPVHVMVRPHSRGYNYSASDFNLMSEEIGVARDAGAKGVVFGILRADGTVDIERTRTLVDLAHPLEVTFHRAIDATLDIKQALEDVITAGCRRILTSGGAADVSSGAHALAGLVSGAADRIAIAIGGGLRLHNVRAVAEITGAQHFHGSLAPEEGSPSSLADRVRTMMQILQEACINSK